MRRHSPSSSLTHSLTFILASNCQWRTRASVEGKRKIEHRLTQSGVWRDVTALVCGGRASTRVPLVIAGPNIVHATYLQATSLVDLYPTLLDLAKSKRFENHDIDGHSLVPLLDGTAGETIRIRTILFFGFLFSFSTFLRESKVDHLSRKTGRKYKRRKESLTRRRPVYVLRRCGRYAAASVGAVAGPHGGQRDLVVCPARSRPEDYRLRHGARPSAFYFWGFLLCV